MKTRPSSVNPSEATQVAHNEQAAPVKDATQETAENIIFFAAYMTGLEAGAKYGASRARVPTVDELDAWADLQVGTLAYSPDESVIAGIPKIKAALKRGFGEGYKKATEPAF